MTGVSAVNLRLQSRWTALARVGWLLLTALTILLYLVGVPKGYATLLTLCNGFPDCANQQLNPMLAHQLANMGLSIRLYAWYFTALGALHVLVCLIIASVIFWRRSDERMALFISAMLIAWGIGGWVTLGPNHNPMLQSMALIIQVIGNICIALLFFVFPDGRFVPRWTRWLALIFVVREILAVLLPADAPGSGAIQALFFLGIPLGLYIQWYRYRRVSTAVERQQTKWVVFGMMVGAAGYASVILWFMLTWPDWHVDNLLAYTLGSTALYLFNLVIPVSIAMAILRSHLWDIDILIRRTLIYGVLTAVLAIVYLGSVVLFQEILRGLTGQASDLAIVASTLVIAGLFAPMRSRIQEIIDRRLYRGKYNAAQVLSAFGATVRDEVDLGRLKEELLAVVEETMRPSSVSLWLKKAERK